MKKSIIFLGIFLAAVSCQKEDLIIGENPSENEVQLICVMNNTGLDLSATTKSGILNPTSDLTEPLRIGLLRVDRNISEFEENQDKPNYNLVFDNSIPANAPTYDEYKTKDVAPHYYTTTGNVGATHNMGYRQVTGFETSQYFLSETNMINFIGWYPVGNHTSGGTDPYRITQALDLKTDVMHSGIIRKTQSKVYNDTLVFQHDLCQFRIHIYRMQQVDENGNEVFDSNNKPVGVEGWGNLTDIKVLDNATGLTYELPDGVTYTYPSETTETSLKEVLPIASKSSSDGTITYPDGCGGVYFIGKTDGNEGVDIPVGYDAHALRACYLAAPPKDGKLKLKVESTEAVSSKDITIANTFRPGYAYDIILCFSDHNLINHEVSITEWKYDEELNPVTVDVEATMYYDLSRYGTANCYIIASANNGYSFNGLVKGCGDALGGGTVVGETDCSLPGDTYIDIIYDSWEEEDKAAGIAESERHHLIELKENTLVNGQVMFDAIGERDAKGKPTKNKALLHKGNVIIAAYDTKGGDILWTWHIWVTDRPLDQGYSNGYTFMDRYLGATFASDNLDDIRTHLLTSKGEEVGFYYQWGRKDPMIAGFTTVNGDKVDIATTIKENIKTFYGAGDIGRTGWHTAEAGISDGVLWGYRENQNLVKTIYDPCPPGYRVPEHISWSKGDFMSRKSTSAVSTVKSYLTSSSFTSDGHRRNDVTGSIFYGYTHNGTDVGCSSTNYYCAGGYYNLDNKYIWYPGTGWISAHRATVGGKIVPFTTETNSYAANNAASFNAVLNGYDVEAELDMADACPVRCVSENVTRIVKNLSDVQTANCYIVSSAGDYKFKADVRGNGASKVSVGGRTSSVFDESNTIPHSSISFYTVLWWQGDLSGASNNNTKGTDCPIKFINTGRYLPASPARTTGFTDNDLGVIDDEGYLHFTIENGTYSHGNAIIAAFNSQKQILWSWHIWLTDAPEIIKIGPRTFTENGGRTYTHTYYSMDRNLGATYAPSESELSAKELSGTDTQKNAKRLGSYGFYYQWGRKDPFPGPSGVKTVGSAYSSSTWYMRNISGNFGWVSRNSLIDATAARTREAVIQSPTTFNHNSYSVIGSELFRQGGVRYTNWHTTDWTAAGVDMYQFMAMWGCSSSSENSAYDPRMTKTINDPCPPGYYIPDHYFFATAGLGTTGMLTQVENNREVVSAMPSNSIIRKADERGLFISGGSSTDGQVDRTMWIPYGGYRTGTDGENYHLVAGSPSPGWAALAGFPTSKISAVYQSGMEYNAFTQTGWKTAEVRQFCVQSVSGTINVGQYLNFPADAAPVRCRAY